MLNMFMMIVMMIGDIRPFGFSQWRNEMARSHAHKYL